MDAFTGAVATIPPHTGRTDALSRTDGGDSDNTGHKCSITMRIGGLLPDLAERALAL
jgi:hypothetical protein